MSDQPSRRPSLGNLLKIGLGLAILVVAGLAVPWRDTIEYARPEGKVVVEGELLGAWDQATVSFQFDENTVVGADWPDHWVAARASGEPLKLERNLESPDESPEDWRPGLLTVFAGLALLPLLAALAVFFVGVFASMVRWWRLLAIAGCGTPFRSVFRLTFLGLFFNLVVPGLTGGDLIKAVMVVREHPEQRADAFVSAVVDRVFGLIGLLVLASGVVLVIGERLQELRTPVLVLTGVALLATVCVLHPWPRKLIRLESWLHRLPQGDKLESVDRAVRSYAKHPATLLLALLISVFNHVVNATAVFIIAASLHAGLGLGDILCAASLASLVSAAPLSPGGLGVEEAVYVYLFGLLGSTSSLGLAVGLTKRAAFTTLGLLGGLTLLMPGGRALRSDLRAVRTENR